MFRTCIEGNLGIVHDSFCQRTYTFQEFQNCDHRISRSSEIAVMEV